MQSIKTYTYIDGIGDEVIYGVIGISLAVMSSLYMW